MLFMSLTYCYRFDSYFESVCIFMFDFSSSFSHFCVYLDTHTHKHAYIQYIYVCMCVSAVHIEDHFY